MQEQIILTAEKDESLIRFLIEIDKVNANKNPKEGWRMQKQYCVSRLGEEYCLDTVVDGNLKYFSFFIGDCEKLKIK